MTKVKVSHVTTESIHFDNGLYLFSDHDPDCCENHYLDFEHISIEDFKGLEFDLSGDSFFNRIPDYGIELVPIHGHSVKIPGYGYNNGYYSDRLDLVLTDGDSFRVEFDITDCQEVSL